MTHEEELNLQTLEEAISDRVSQLRQEHDQAKFSDFEFEGRTYDFPDGPSNQADLASLVAAGTGENLKWTCADGSHSIKKPEKLKEFSNALNARALSLFNARTVAIKKVRAAKTKAKARSA